jgi:transposase, IS5 family
MEPERKRIKSYFGYKLHQKSDIDYGLIREIETSTAKVHDSRVDLSIKDEVIIQDRGYFGVPARGDYFAVVHRTTDAPQGELDKERNRLICKLRSSGERLMQ